LTSYLLIGFWYHKPSAAAAAKKAFVTTRIGDLAFLLGIVWLYSQSSTLLFYDDGKGCLEKAALAGLVSQTTVLGMTVSAGIGLLIFCGAIGKSGQVPLHVWLPDAMEGPTPVSALIHAATMVAAGVFLVARVYPLMAAAPIGGAAQTTALQVVTWVGAITAVFAASIAVAQTDIKRILAYSTVSQLGFMMIGLGTGGVAVGMFHLITHAFFKALLFMGAGSVIHGCHEEQDIRRMGGLRQFMPVTFATYAVGMLALCGFPLLFSGFWSKDEILHSAHLWSVSQWPFYLGVLGALLTAFYMTRQVFYVFFGTYRGAAKAKHQAAHSHGDSHAAVHESPTVMTAPLVVLATSSVLLGFLGTPAWPWFQNFLGAEPSHGEANGFLQSGALSTMVVSTIVVFIGIGLGYRLYGRKPISSPDEVELIERTWPNLLTLLRRKYYVDEAYEWAVVGFNAWWARAIDWMDRWVWSSAIQLVVYGAMGLAWLDRLFDEFVINQGFDQVCERLRNGGGLMARLQDGQVQRYLRLIGIGMVVLTLILIWGCRAS
jgi:NADH-quinone oxidoreductase subunit L